MSSEENDISTQLKTLDPKQKDRGAQRLRQRRRSRVQKVYKIQTQSPVSRRKRKILMRFASVPAYTLRGNYFSTPICLPITKYSVPVVFPMRELRNGHIENVSRQENMLCTFPSKSFKVNTDSKPSFYTSAAFKDLTYHLYNTEGCNYDTFRRGKRMPCSSRLVSNKEASSITHKLVSDCIRNSQFPINTNLWPASSIAPSRDRFYSQQSSSNLTNSTPKDSPTLQERGTTRNTSESISSSSFYSHPTFHEIESGHHMTSSPISTKPYNIPKQPLALEKISLSPCSTLAEIGSMEYNLGNVSSSSSTAEPCSLSESSLHSSEQMCGALRSSSSCESLNSSRESWDKEGSTSNINQSFMCLDSPNLRLKDNFTYSESPLEENATNITPQKNENSSKTIIFPVKRQCPLQLQIDVLPSNTSTTPVSKAKYDENVSGSISRPSHSPILYPRPVAKSSHGSKGINFSFEEYVRKYTSLENNDSMMSPICPEEPIQQGVGEFVSTLNPPESLKCSKERHCTANIFANVRKSFASLSMTQGSPTKYASEKAITSNRFNSEQSANNKNKTKKSKLLSCFTVCLRPSSPRQENQT